MKLIEEKGMLHYIYTQNIDGLELKAGVSSSKCVFAHGVLTEAHCSMCGKECSIEDIKTYADKETVLYCDDCNGPCKPKVVLYGEQLPKSFFDKMNFLSTCDLCFIMGSTLKVTPFSYLPYNVSNKCVRVLINLEKVGVSNQDEKSFNFEGNRDLFLKGKCDEIISQIVSDLEW